MNSIRARHRIPLDPALSKIPEPPEEFGQDGGRFYECYDKLAEAIDDEITYGLDKQLEGLLVFAGLFATVNTTFLFITIPMLWADPYPDLKALMGQTNAILLQIAMARNDSIPVSIDLPSTSYAPSDGIVTINVLFSLSLTFALISAFIAMLGRQWLFWYRKQSGGGPDRERWAQLQRFLAARRWHLELILDDGLSSLLQIGLIIFCFAFVTFLRTLSVEVSTIVSIPLVLAVMFIVGTALCVTWDKFCPFQSPLSRFFEWLTQSIPLVIHLLAKGFTSFSESLKEAWNAGRLDDQRHTPRRFIKAMREFKFTSVPDHSHPDRPLTTGRKEESLEYLQILALQRSVCTSDDPVTLFCAVANIPTITNPQHLQELWDDKPFQERLIWLYVSSFDRTLRLLGRDRIDLAMEARRLFGAAVTHILFYLDQVKSVSDVILPCLRDTEGFKPLGTRAPRSIPDDTLPVFVQTSLAHALISILHFPPITLDIQALCAHINSCSNALIYPDWKLLTLISWAIAQLPRIGSLYNSDFERMARAFRGDVDVAPELISQAIEVLSARNHVYTLDCDRVLPGSNPTQSQNEENTQTFIALRPVLDNVLSPETVFEWENGEHTADERPTSLVQRLDRLRQGLNQFMPGQDLYQNGPETSEADTSVSHGSST